MRSDNRKAATPTVAHSTDVQPGTRERVLAAARELITERGDAAITLVEVAARAGYSRQTLYLLFRNRAGLLLAMLDDMDRAHGADDRLAAACEGGPAHTALEAYVRVWFEFLPAVLPVARALTAAAAAGDADARVAWESRKAKLLGGFRYLARALHRDGRLREGWTPEAAADWAYALTHVDLWHQLVVETGWTPTASADRIVAALRVTLVADRSGRAPGASRKR